MRQRQQQERGARRSRAGAEVSRKAEWYARGMARQNCGVCSGSGLVKGAVCKCVHRAVFQAVLQLCREIERCERGEPVQIGYAIDFQAIVRRVLSPAQFRIFELYHLRQMHWRDCMERLQFRRERSEGTARTAFYRALEAIEAAAGCALFGGYGRMFPPCEYFSHERLRYPVRKSSGKWGPRMVEAQA